MRKFLVARGVCLPHLVDASPGRPLSKDSDQLSQRRLGAGHFELDAPIGAVTNPPGNPSATRGFAYEPSEAYALHAPVNFEAQPHPCLSARALQQRRQHRRQERLIARRAACAWNKQITRANPGCHTLQRRRDILTRRWRFGAR